MNIATINDTLLPVVLFVIYFCFVSIIVYNLKDNKSETEVNRDEQELEESPKAFTYRDAFSADYDPVPVPKISEKTVTSVELESVFKVEALISPVLTDEKSINVPTTTHSNYQSIPEIIDSLGKRNIRKLCSPLGIQQKTNGTELTTELMKALVKRKFKENPQMVVEVMSDRFPQLLPTIPEANQQQQLDSLAC
jgi:hypothetical protein